MITEVGRLLLAGDIISMPSTNRITSLITRLLYIHTAAVISRTPVFFAWNQIFNICLLKARETFLAKEKIWINSNKVLCVLSTSTTNQAEPRGLDTAFETFILGKEWTENLIGKVKWIKKNTWNRWHFGGFYGSWPLLSTWCIETMFSVFIPY